MSSSRQAVFAAEGLSVGYGAIPVVRGLNIEVFPGEIVALLGANGSGKTTTLLALAGELSPQSGSVAWCGDRKAGPLYKRARAGLGFVTEERSVFMQLTVAENLRLGRGSVSDALELMPELSPLLRRRAGLLSGGEQQMLTLARALASECRGVLIDEISLGLAPVIVRRLLRAVRQAAVERQLAVVLVEQHVSSALELSDRAVVLRRGTVVLEGKSKDLLSRVDEVRHHYL